MEARPNVVRWSVTESTKQNQRGDPSRGARHRGENYARAIRRSGATRLVINEPERAELVHDETSERTGGTDHLGQRSFTDLGNDHLRLALRPQMGQQQQPRQQSRRTRRP